MSNCELCGEPMPKGEEMFKFHGYSGPCPKPPKERPPINELETSVAAIRKWQRHWLLRQYGENGHVLPENLELSGHIDRLISAVIDEASYADLRASGGIAGAP